MTMPFKRSPKSQALPGGRLSPELDSGKFMKQGCFSSSLCRAKDAMTVRSHSCWIGRALQLAKLDRPPRTICPSAGSSLINSQKSLSFMTPSVKFPSLRNKYAYLKIDSLEDAEPVEACSSWTITDSRREIITITTTVLPDGTWVYGYKVYWSDGRISTAAPSTEQGRFCSQRDAKLYAIGFMLIYLPHFLPETQDAIRDAEKQLIQTQLFD